MDIGWATRMSATHHIRKNGQKTWEEMQIVNKHFKCL
jgi:hypothetical protein